VGHEGSFVIGVDLDDDDSKLEFDGALSDAVDADMAPLNMRCDDCEHVLDNNETIQVINEVECVVYNNNNEEEECQNEQ